jgi:hypothetical protein
MEQDESVSCILESAAGERLRPRDCDDRLRVDYGRRASRDHRESSEVCPVQPQRAPRRRGSRPTAICFIGNAGQSFGPRFQAANSRQMSKLSRILIRPPESVEA